jgi:hypothetical protein
MFAQLFYTIDTFPYDDTMTIRINKKNKKKFFWLNVLWLLWLLLEKTTPNFHNAN